MSDLSSNPERCKGALPAAPVALIDAARLARYRGMRTRPRGLLLLCEDLDFLTGYGRGEGFAHFLDTARFVYASGAPAFEDGMSLRRLLDRERARGDTAYAYRRAALTGAATRGGGAIAGPLHAALRDAFVARLGENPLFAKASVDTDTYMHGQYAYLVDGVCQALITRAPNYDEIQFFAFRIVEDP